MPHLIQSTTPQCATICLLAWSASFMKYVLFLNARVGADAVMRQQHKHTKSSKKKAALGQWVQVRRPSAYGQTRTDQHR